jgi:hypothetical protein
MFNLCSSFGRGLRLLPLSSLWPLGVLAVSLGRPSLARAASEGGVASSADAEPRTALLVETDPATFAFRGHSAHVRVAPRSLPGGVLGAGLYGQDLPQFVPNLHPKNADDAFAVSIREAYAIFADYHFAGRPTGLFVGTQVAVQRSQITSRGEQPARQAETVSVLVMPRIGYLWHPLAGSGVYLLPWVGAGPSLEVHRSKDKLADYHALPVLAFGALHLGWKF